MGRSAGKFLLALLATGHAWAQTPGSYTIEAQSSRVQIRVFRGGLLGGFGDNHLIELRPLSGTAESSPAAPWLVHVFARSGALRVIDPGASPATREQVQQAMLSAKVLDASRYQTIELQSRSLAPGVNDRSWRMVADLTLHGVTRQVEFPLSWEEHGDRLHVRGSTKLLLRDFNIEPPRVAMGAVKVRNEFELVYDITLRKQ